MLTAAVGRSRSGIHEAFIRTVAHVCLQLGLVRQGTMYVLNPVECHQIGVKMKQLQVSFPGKLLRYLETPPNSQYFIRIGRPRSRSPFKKFVLADLPALISSQHRTAEVQAILSRMNANQLVHVTTKNVPATTQQLQATHAQQLASTSQAATSVSQAPAQRAAPPNQQAQALPPVQQTVPQHQTQQTAGQQGSLPANVAEQSAQAYEGNDTAGSSHTSRRFRLKASPSQPNKHVSNRCTA